MTGADADARAAHSVRSAASLTLPRAVVNVRRHGRRSALRRERARRHDHAQPARPPQRGDVRARRAAAGRLPQRRHVDGCSGRDPHWGGQGLLLRRRRRGGMGRPPHGSDDGRARCGSAADDARGRAPSSTAASRRSPRSTASRSASAWTWRCSATSASHPSTRVRPAVREDGPDGRRHWLLVPASSGRVRDMAARLLLTGDIIDAQRSARASGLVSQVVPAERADGRGASPRGSHRGEPADARSSTSKKGCAGRRARTDSGLPDLAAFVGNGLARLFTTADHKEAVAAFMARSDRRRSRPVGPTSPGRLMLERDLVLPHIIAAHARTTPDRLAMKDVEGREITYAELERRAAPVGGRARRVGRRSGRERRHDGAELVRVVLRVARARVVRARSRFRRTTCTSARCCAT